MSHISEYPLRSPVREVVRRVTRTVSGIYDALLSFIFGANAQSNVPSYDNTGTLPTALWLRQYDGTLSDHGGAVNEDGEPTTLEGGRLAGGVVYTTDASGNTLQPYTLFNGQKDFIWYPARENSTAYTLGQKMSVVCTDGIERWFTCTTAGTTHTSNPGYPADATPTTDGTAVFTGAALNYHTLKGQRVHPAYTNKGLFDVPRPVVGSNLLTGNNTDMSGANSWDGSSLGTFDVNSTVPGKMYGVGDGSTDGFRYNTLLTGGKVYNYSLKARLNSGASTTLRIGRLGIADTDYYDEFTPTGTEQTFTGSFIAYDNILQIGLASPGFNGVAFEVDDVVIQEVTDGLGTISYHNGATFVNNISNLTLSGDVAATLIVVDATSLVGSAIDEIGNTVDLSEIVDNGTANQYLAVALDNSGGAAPAYVDIGGVSGNTNAHTASIFAQGSAYTLKLDGTAGSAKDAHTYLTRDTQTITPADAAQLTRVELAAGETVTFLLPQFTETAVAMPLTTSNTTVSATSMQSTWPSAVKGGSLAVEVEFVHSDVSGGVIVFANFLSAADFIRIISSGAAVGYQAFLGGVAVANKVFAVAPTAYQSRTVQVYSGTAGYGVRVKEGYGAWSAYQTGSGFTAALTTSLSIAHQDSTGQVDGWVRKIKLYGGANAKANMEAG